MTLLSLLKSQVRRLAFLPELQVVYWVGQLAAHWNGAEALAPGLVTMIAPGKAPPQSLPFAIKVLKELLPTWKSLGFTFFGEMPPMVTTAPSLKFWPVILSEKTPDALRSSLQADRTATSGPGPGGGGGTLVALQVNVTCIPCSFPNGHPAGAPAGNVVRFRLVPPGPTRKIRNDFPAFARRESELRVHQEARQVLHCQRSYHV